MPAKTRDWTRVLYAGCDECGWTPFDPRDAATRLEASVPHWEAALHRPGVSQRPDPQVWSPVEYAAHARDMVRVLGERTTAMLDADDPQFADWGGDAKNVELSYFRADPAAIAQDLAQQTARTASILREVGDRVVGAGGDDPAEVQPPRKSAAIPPAMASD